MADFKQNTHIRSNRDFRSNRTNGNSNFNNRPPVPPRKMYDSKCFQCEKACKIPFIPKTDKPIYCKECFLKNKSKQNLSPPQNLQPVKPQVQIQQSAQVQQSKTIAQIQKPVPNLVTSPAQVSKPQVQTQQPKTISQQVQSAAFISTTLLPQFQAIIEEKYKRLDDKLEKIIKMLESFEVEEGQDDKEDEEVDKEVDLADEDELEEDLKIQDRQTKLLQTYESEDDEEDVDEDEDDEDDFGFN